MPLTVQDRQALFSDLANVLSLDNPTRPGGKPSNGRLRDNIRALIREEVAAQLSDLSADAPKETATQKGSKK